MRRLAAELAEKADRIFIGSVKDATDSTATFFDIVNLKGATEEGFRVVWKEPENFLIGCDGTVDFKNVIAPDPDPDGPDLLAYLVYSKGGQLLRAKEVGSFADKPTGYEELEWLEAGKHVQIEVRQDE